MGDGRLVEAAEVEEGDDCLEEVEADVTNRLHAVVLTACASRIHFAMLVFLLVEEYRVKEGASRKPLGEGPVGREAGLCDRSQNNHLEDHSYDHHQRPKPRQGPCQQFHQLEQEAWQHASRGAFCGRARVTLRNVVGLLVVKVVGGS